MQTNKDSKTIMQNKIKQSKSKKNKTPNVKETTYLGSRRVHLRSTLFGDVGGDLWGKFGGESEGIGGNAFERIQNLLIFM